MVIISVALVWALSFAGVAFRPKRQRESCPTRRCTSDVKFGKWKKDPGKDRCYCEYPYPSKSHPVVLNVQMMIYYPNDPARRDYSYFANKENQISGRCIQPPSLRYDPRAMQWLVTKEDGWCE